MANEKNLRPFTSEQSHEEAVKNGAKGGIASGKAKRKAKSLRDLAQMIGEKKHPNEKLIKQVAEALGVDVEDITHNCVIIGKQFIKAEQGDTRSAEFVAKMRGEYIERTFNETEIKMPNFNITEE